MVNADLLDHIIAQQDIAVHFQPIFDINHLYILGYEALSRGPEDSPLHTPDQLFGLADKLGRLSELELVCRKKAIERFVELGLKSQLFLNVSPQVLLDRRHPRGETAAILKQFGLPCHQVVIEITEQQQVDDQLLKQAVNYYRDLGFSIAMDDLGSGHSGLRQWSELMPDIIKIDRYFIHNCHIDVVKKEFLRSILSLAKATNTQVIAEGIEQQAELKQLSSLGVSFAQGFLLERPCDNPSKFFPANISETIGKFAAQENTTVRGPAKLRHA